jgi:hypothetical protein
MVCLRNITVDTLHNGDTEDDDDDDDNNNNNNNTVTLSSNTTFSPLKRFSSYAESNEAAWLLH